ncbi:MAG: copper chaperone PCu(A)C [Pseudomonadota bacterium]
MLFRKVLAPLTALLMTATLAHAEGPVANAGDIFVAEAKSRPMIPNRPAAIYMLIENVGGTADRLVSVSSPAFEVLELHETTEKDGVMQMARLPSIEVPAGGLVMLEPGGLHIMGFGAPEPKKEGDEFPLTLTFETAGELTITVMVGKIEVGHDHGGHDHSGHDHSGHNHGHGTKD